MTPFVRLALAALLLLPAAACGLATSPSRDRRGLDTFEDDVRGARTLSEEFWKQYFAASGATYRPINDFVPYSGADGPACGGQPSAPNNAFYCSAGHFIAYDEEWMRTLWSRIGDGSVYLIIPHEFGHAVQAQMDTAFELNVQLELQADCYAGGTLRALIDSGALTAEPGDEEELLLNLAAAGDPTDDWLDPAAHGTAEQRQRSFAAGYTRGVDAC
ncbi:neutral zinc metallopeptidase [Nonomuraea sp. MCN248]|uniref:Neutral zinc metallopeptidase n=1 Tax=Nonomuraea corallina TaxID=2989783 RepID=A0ABT4SJV3_9ACTN|nr:neutral zinc metallopeptidase [Nonomuraea corallina]MDA0637501.1 neutral zinc metallopeptidase [Nonomuraea corallina]